MLIYAMVFIGGMCGGLVLAVVLWSRKRKANNYEWISERMF